MENRSMLSLATLSPRQPSCKLKFFGPVLVLVNLSMLEAARTVERWH